jgi:hypothetical protein
MTWRELSISVSFQGSSDVAAASTPEDLQKLKHDKLMVCVDIFTSRAVNLISDAGLPLSFHQGLLENYRTLQKEQQLAKQHARAMEDNPQ